MNKWDARFMQLTETVATWSSCFQENRHGGAIIVKDKRVMTTGYNGAPAGIKTCVERGECLREKLGIASGTRAELCYAVHAEQNAIIQAARLGSSIDGATLYCTHQPCVLCAKMIVNAGIKRVVYREGYPDDFARQMLGEGGVPFALIFTKCDKQSATQTQRSVTAYKKRLAEQWEELPPMLLSSSENGQGREEILAFVDKILAENAE